MFNVLKRASAALLAGSLLVTTMMLTGAPDIHAAGRTSVPRSSLVPAGWPHTVLIPRIGVHAAIESVPLNRATDASAPYRWEDAGWYSRGVRPGDPGRAVIFGHLDSTCCPAVFWSLNALKPGDIVEVGYGRGALHFRVMWQHVYTNAAMPTRWMYGRGGQRALVLFTCAGIFHRDGTGYDHKLMVFARLIMPNGRLG
jgi:sortase (surface protein transpeptidase)